MSERSVGMMPTMGIEATLHRLNGERLRGLSDPNGGTFDAAGDFDRLIGSEDLRIIGSLDPYGDAVLGAETMVDLMADVDSALAAGRDGPERRGLRRLRAMAEMVRANDSLTLRVVGD